MRRRPFFGLHLNLGAKFWNEIELLSLTKFVKTFRPLRICLINKNRRLCMSLIFYAFKTNEILDECHETAQNILSKIIGANVAHSSGFIINLKHYFHYRTAKTCFCFYC